MLFNKYLLNTQVKNGFNVTLIHYGKCLIEPQYGKTSWLIPTEFKLTNKKNKKRCGDAGD